MAILPDMNSDTVSGYITCSSTVDCNISGRIIHSFHDTFFLLICDTITVIWKDSTVLASTQDMHMLHRYCPVFYNTTQMDHSKYFTWWWENFVDNIIIVLVLGLSIDARSTDSHAQHINLHTKYSGVSLYQMHTQQLLHRFGHNILIISAIKLWARIFQPNSG